MSDNTTVSKSSKTLKVALISGLLGWAIYYLGYFISEPSPALSSYAKFATLLLMLSCLTAFFELFRNTFKGGMRGLTLAGLLLCTHLLVLTINGTLNRLY